MHYDHPPSSTFHADRIIVVEPHDTAPEIIENARAQGLVTQSNSEDVFWVKMGGEVLSLTEQELLERMNTKDH
jgi:hypothetical protein